MTTIRLNGRNVKPHKATTNPDLAARTVLTNSHWEYVSLWLRRSKKVQALFYWQQAQVFAKAAEGMPVESAPLLLYYTFMNAAKELLSAKGVPFDEHHGVRAHNMRGASRKITLSNEGVRIMSRGVAPALSQHLRESESSDTHSMEDLLFNMPCIHRTFCLTYRNQKDLFVPLTECQIRLDSHSSSAYFSGRISEDFPAQYYINRLPTSLTFDPSVNDGRTIRSASSTHLSNPPAPTDGDILAIATLLGGIRADLNYIAGTETLWYVKAKVSGPKRLERSPLTCTLVAMHRLSEICRYRPMELAAFLSGQKNWLLTEFIRMAPQQFIDEIAAELTGQQFMIPNVRPSR
ncbi:hypothetical protein KBY86_01840 [Synechococcus sp. Lug-A]|uniref:YaaC family protein n=1 Tax=Synechococcus sp. Lug-A TaxID=2823740 RepID=UPI0020CF4406|nr:YaaC family protein [Synechococcus sp. Lug-A]MCP9845643.1 hypothetical protein [Synechococcus sp. Lug-A]